MTLGSEDPGVLLKVSDLTLAFKGERGLQTVLHEVSFEAQAGKCLAIVGESGSGKTVSTMALLGLLPAVSTRVQAGRALYRCRDDTTVDLLGMERKALRRLRGVELSAVFQDPMTALNPVFRVGEQIAETLRLNRGLDARAARTEALRWLERVEIPEAARRLDVYPHELSGGMRQRVMIAIALCCEPRLLVADEPTTALDVIVQAQVLELIRRLQRETGTTVLFITHDFGVVASMADQVIVMRHGRVVERGAADQVLHAPRDTYTQRLLASVPDIDRARPAVSGVPGDGEVLAQMEGVQVRYRSSGLAWRRRREAPAVDDASLQLRRGETLALVGESGSGKTTLGRALLRLLPHERGRIVVLGHELSTLSPAHLKPLRRQMQMVFQDPYSSLDPRMSIGQSLGEPLAIHEPELPASVVLQRVQDWLRRVQLPADAARRYPHEFSGGQRQRIVIARALMLQPQIVVADEAVSSLDVSLQAEVLDLLATLKRDLGLSLLFITHNLGVVRHFCDRAIVMKDGRIVEEADCEVLFSAPAHPYTRELIAAVPRLSASRPGAFPPQGFHPHPSTGAQGDRAGHCP